MTEQIAVHSTESRLLNVTVQVDVKQLKNDDVVAAEVEAIQHFDNTVLVRVFRIYASQQLCFAAGVVNVLLFIFADFNGNTTSAFFHVNATHDLAKCTRIDYFFYEVAIAELLANMRTVKPVSTCHLAHALHTVATNRVNELIRGQLRHLVRGKFTFVLLERFNWRKALQGCLYHWLLRILRLSSATTKRRQLVAGYFAKSWT